MNVPTVKYSGILKIAPDLEITVHVLGDGRRIIPVDDMKRALEWLAAAPSDLHPHEWVQHGFYSVCECGARKRN